MWGGGGGHGEWGKVHACGITQAVQEPETSLSQVPWPGPDLSPPHPCPLLFSLGRGHPCLGSAPPSPRREGGSRKITAFRYQTGPAQGLETPDLIGLRRSRPSVGLLPGQWGARPVLVGN